MSTHPRVASTSAIVGMLSNDLMEAASDIRLDMMSKNIKWCCWLLAVGRWLNEVRLAPNVRVGGEVDGDERKVREGKCDEGRGK